VAEILSEAVDILETGPSHTRRRRAAGLAAMAELYVAGGRPDLARRALRGAFAAYPPALRFAGVAATLLKSLLPAHVLGQLRARRELTARKGTCADVAGPSPDNHSVSPGRFG
jgi:hypothetical protein